MFDKATISVLKWHWRAVPGATFNWCPNDRDQPNSRRAKFTHVNQVNAARGAFLVSLTSFCVPLSTEEAIFTPPFRAAAELQPAQSKYQVP